MSYRGIGRVSIVCCLFFFLQGGCTSSKKKAEETASAIERMNRENQQYLQKQSSSQNKGEEKLDRELVDGIAARVNDEIILISDVDQFSKLLSRRMGSSLSRDALRTKMARRQVLERLIEMKLIEQRAKELGIEVEEEDVINTVEQIKEKSGMTHKDFLVQLAKEGLNYKDYLSKVKSDIKRRRLLEIEVKARTQVSDEECKQYYDKHIEEYTTVARARIQQILLQADRKRLDKKEIKEIGKRMKDIRKEVLNGADFGEMAKKYSMGPNSKDGGDVGYFKKGELLPEIERASFSLQVGEISRILQTNIGFHLFRLTEKEDGNRTPFEEVKEEIRQKLVKEAYLKRMEKWIEELKERAFIDMRI